MTSQVPTIDIHAARKVCEAAKGSWQHDDDSLWSYYMTEGEEAFVILARSVLPAALDELEAARKEVEKLRDVLTNVEIDLRVGMTNAAYRRTTLALSPERRLT